MPKLTVTVGAKLDAVGRNSLGQRIRRIVARHGGNQQRWLITHLTRIADEEEKAQGLRTRARRTAPAQG